MPIVYDKLLELLRKRGISIYRLKAEKIIGTATIDKIRKGEGHLDTRSIDKLCRYLNCQPGDILSYISSTEEAAERSVGNEG